MFIANNSIFKSIMQYLFSQINSAEGVLPNDEFWEKKSFYRFWTILKNANLMSKPPQNLILWKVGYPNIFSGNMFLW